MAFDGITTANLTYELNEALADSRINRVIQPEKNELYLYLHGRAGNKILYMSANPSLPLVYLTPKAPKAPESAPAFCMFLRKHIQNGRIISVTQPGLERVIRINIEHRDEMGDLCTRVLIIELMGKHSNIILTDENDRIMDSVKHVSAQTSTIRQVLPGREYFIPDTMNKKDPLSAERGSFWESVTSRPWEISKAIYQSYTGISPVFAEEICYECGIDGGTPVSNIPPEDISKIYDKLCSYAEMIKNGDFTPHIVYVNGIPREFGSFPYHMFADGVQKYPGSMSQVLIDYYSEKSLHTRMKQKSADLRQAVTTVLSREVRKLEVREKQYKDTEKMDILRLRGELLNAYGYDLKLDSDSVVLNDYNTGEDVTVPVDPGLTPYENARKYFDRYNKLKRTRASVTELIEKAREDIEILDNALTELDLAEDEADLREIRKELEQSGFVKETKKGKGKRERNERSTPLMFRSSSGLTIYVGKNNIQNDEITFRIASPDDWWFHAKQMPGSHVIIKSGGSEVPDSAFEEAARLAAHFSKGKDADKVEVDYVQRRHIKKPNSAKPGFVIYHTNYSMTAGTDITGIERIST